MAKKRRKMGGDAEGEFIWLMSLSDLMILLFIFFVVLYSFAQKKLKETDYVQMLEAFGNENVKDPTEQIKQNVSAWVAENDLAGLIEVVNKDGELHVEIKDKVFFSVGKYDLHEKGASTLRKLAGALEAIPPPYQLAIEGHTDDVPIKTRTISNNFELSAKRAISVFNILDFSEQFKERVVISAYGETKPLVPNRNEAGASIPANQSKNRRVTLRIY